MTTTKLVGKQNILSCQYNLILEDWNDIMKWQTRFVVAVNYCALSIYICKTSLGKQL
jgi:ferritin-like protein